MSAQVGALHVEISANSATFNQDIGKVSSRLKRFEGEARAASAAIGRAFGGLAAAFSAQQLGQFALESITAAAELGRLSDQAGLTVDQFQRLDFAMRGAMQPTEALAATLSAFSRNLSDLQRNQGGFLQFLRQSAPELIEQFRAARDTSEALGILSDVIANLGNRHDRLRIAQAAGGEQMAKFVNELARGRLQMQEAQQGFQGLTDAAVQRAQDIERRFSEMWRNLRLRAQEGVLAMTDVFRSRDAGSMTDNLREIARLEGIIASQRTLGRDTTRTQEQLNKLYDEQVALLGRSYEAASRLQSVTAGDDAARRQLEIEALRNQMDAAQGLVDNLNGIPTASQFASAAFTEAHSAMDAAMIASGQTAASVARMKRQLLLQEQALILDTASMMASTLTTVFHKNKGASIAAALINTAVAVTKALQLPPPFNWIQAGLVAAAGAAQVSQIRSVSESGTGGGGAVSSGGGESAAAAAPATNLFITGVQDGFWYRGEQMRELFASMNEHMRNGGKLQIG